MIDRPTLDRLIALGRERGELTASELQAALPVETLDVDALVMVMLELEEAGVSVEPDAFGPRAETVPASTLTLATPEPELPRTITRSGEDEHPVSAVPPSTGGAMRDAEETETVGRVILLAGLTVLLILGAIVVLI